MKNRKRIYLSSPEHYLYDELLECPPENVEYIMRDLSFYSSPDINNLQVFKYIKDKFKNRINSHIVSSKNPLDLIQSNGSIIYDSETLWTVDFEDGTAFTYLNTPTKEEKERVSEVLSSEKCKKLIPHCEAAKESFFNLYEPSENIKNKTEVVYPAFHAPENFDQETEKFSILFVAREFERKGGYEAYRAFKKLNKYHDNLEFICVSNAPESLKKEDIENTRFYQDVERDKLYDLYREADIFVYPTFHDTFGLVMIEAMSHGNPVITIDDFATPEIVNAGEDGYRVKGYDEKWFDTDTKIRIDKYNNWKVLREQHREEEKDRIVQEIVDKISVLLEDREKYKKLSDNAREKIESGKFSIEKRNKKLNRIYRNAVSD